jgi:two-component system cell cycle response regulator
MNETEKANILLVDDRPQNLLALQGLLEGLDVKVVKATSGNEALSLMLEYDFALVLLDVQMPEMDGFETAEVMRSSPRTKHVPIVFVTAISKDQKHVFKGYETGAVDYLFKPLEPEILISKVKVFVELYRQKGLLESTTKALEQSMEELKKANEERVQRERLQGVIEMAGAVCHELNQPLQAVSGYSDLLLMDMSDDNPLNGDLKKIKKQIARMGKITRKLMRITRYETKDYIFEGQKIIDIDKASGEGK